MGPTCGVECFVQSSGWAFMLLYSKREKWQRDAWSDIFKYISFIWLQHENHIQILHYSFSSILIFHLSTLVYRRKCFWDIYIAFYKYNGMFISFVYWSNMLNGMWGNQWGNMNPNALETPQSWILSAISAILSMPLFFFQGLLSSHRKDGESQWLRPELQNIKRCDARSDPRCT